MNGKSDGSMDGFEVLRYGTHPLQTIHVKPSGQGPVWVVYLHGGAWRDPRSDAHEGYWILQHTSAPGASINYRLSPEVRHPLHLHDARAALAALRAAYPIPKMLLIGHSAGAWLAFQEEMPADCVIGLDGIYDLEELVMEYPAYADFVQMAFGPDREAWRRARARRPDAKRWMLLHSSGDELLSWRQTRSFAARIGGEVREVTGRHQKVFQSTVFCEIVGREIERMG